MQLLDAAATREALPFSALIPALQALFTQGCEVPPRQVHAIAAPVSAIRRRSAPDP